MFGRTKKPQVLCIGSTSVDLFFPTDEGVIIDTPEDVTSQKKLAFELGGKILVPELHTAIGGVAANVSRGLAKLGIPVASYSCLGKDSNGEFCMTQLQESEVNTRHIQVLTEARTDLSAIIVHAPTGERTIIHNRDANKRLILQASDLQAPWIFISALNGEWQKNIETILHAQKKGGFQIAFNPGQHNIKEDSALVLQVVRRAELLVLNKDEAIELVLHKNPESTPQELEDERYLLKNLFQGGARIVALTDGMRGTWVYNGEALWHLAVPLDTKVVDTTGGGDAFTSGFFGALLLKKPLDECLRVGMANSQKVIETYGASESLLSASEIESAVAHLIPQKIQ